MTTVELPFDDPLDQPARDRIANDLTANLFVEAGAGAGKTASLVDRIVALVRSGVDIGAIAAITFTEKAAAELLGVPYAEFTQVALIPTAYSIGTEFRPARRKGVDQVMHVDRW